MVLHTRAIPVTPNSCSCRLAVPTGSAKEKRSFPHSSLSEDHKIAAHVPQRRPEIRGIQGHIGNQTRLGQLDLRAQPESEARLSQSASCVLEQHDMRMEGNVRVQPGQLLTA
jgi:hypothetical protein